MNEKFHIQLITIILQPKKKRFIQQKAFSHPNWEKQFFYPGKTKIYKKKHFPSCCFLSLSLTLSHSPSIAHHKNNFSRLTIDCKQFIYIFFPSSSQMLTSAFYYHDWWPKIGAKQFTRSLEKKAEHLQGTFGRIKC